MVNGNVAAAVDKLNWHIINFLVKIQQVEMVGIVSARIVEIKKINLDWTF